MTKATPAQINEKFVATGAHGDTLKKCLSFFTALAKDAGVTLPTVLRTRKRRTGTKRVNGKDKPPRRVDPPSAEKTAMQMLLESLDPNAMSDDEQQAVWTLLQFVKKQEGSPWGGIQGQRSVVRTKTTTGLS